MNHASASAAGELSEPESRHLAPEEVLERLDSLSAEDKRRLRLIEWRRLSGTDLREGLLYQEAICQALLGERRCPRKVSFVAFLAQSMRSISSRRREALARQVPTTKVDGSGNLVDLPIAADQLDPEETLIEREAADVVAAEKVAAEMDAIAQEAKRLAGKSRLARAKDAVSAFRSNPPNASQGDRTALRSRLQRMRSGRPGENDDLMMAARKGKEMSPSDEEGAHDDLAQLEALESEDPEASKE